MLNKVIKMTSHSLIGLFAIGLKLSFKIFLIELCLLFLGGFVVLSQVLVKVSPPRGFSVYF